MAYVIAAGGWLAVSIIAAVAFHVIRRRYRPLPISPEVRDFIRRLEEVLRQRHPEIGVRGMVAGRFAIVLEVEGQDVPVPLHHLFRHASTYPEGLERMVDVLLGEVRAGGIDRRIEHGLDEVAAHLLPQVRSSEWLRQRSSSFGDSGLVSRPLGDDLRICYVIDDVTSMVFVCQAHLRRWGLTEPALFELATRNLRRLVGAEVPIPGPRDQPVVVSTGDGYDAARVLLLDPDQAEGLLVAMPERDTLWLSREAEAPALAELMSLNREQSELARFPVSGSVYRVRGGRLEPITESPSPPG